MDILEENIQVEPTFQEASNKALEATKAEWASWASTQHKKFVPLMFKTAGGLGKKAFEASQEEDIPFPPLDLWRENPIKFLTETAMASSQVGKQIRRLLPGIMTEDPLSQMDSLSRQAVVALKDISSLFPESSTSKALDKGVVEAMKASDALIDLGDTRLEKEQFKPTSYPMKIADAISTSLQMQLPAITVGVLSGGGLRGLSASLATVAIESAGMTYGELRKKGVDPERARGLANASGYGEALSELIPEAQIFKSNATKLLKSTWGKIFADQFGEQISTAVDAVTEKAYTNPKMTWGDYGQQVLDTVLTTVGQHGIMVGAAEAVKAPIKAIQTKIEDLRLEANLNKVGLEFNISDLKKAREEGPKAVDTFINDLLEKRQKEDEQRFNLLDSTIKGLENNGSLTTKILGKKAREAFEEGDAVRAEELIRAGHTSLSPEERVSAQASIAYQILESEKKATEKRVKLFDEGLKKELKAKEMEAKEAEKVATKEEVSPEVQPSLSEEVLSENEARVRYRAEAEQRAKDFEISQEGSKTTISHKEDVGSFATMDSQPSVEDPAVARAVREGYPLKDIAQIELISAEKAGDGKIAMKAIKDHMIFQGKSVAAIPISDDLGALKFWQSQGVHVKGVFETGGGKVHLGILELSPRERNLFEPSHDRTSITDKVQDKTGSLEVVISNDLRKGRVEEAKAGVKRLRDNLEELRKEDLFAEEAIQESGILKKLEKWKENIRMAEDGMRIEQGPILMHSIKGDRNPFYSKLAKLLIETKQENWKGPELWKYLSNKGIKKGELEYFQLEEFLTSTPEVTLTEVKEKLSELMPRIETKTLEQGNTLSILQSFKEAVKANPALDAYFDFASRLSLSTIEAQVLDDPDDRTKIIDILHAIEREMRENPGFESQTRLDLITLRKSLWKKLLESTQYEESPYHPEGKNYREEVFTIPERKGPEDRNHFSGIESNIGWMRIVDLLQGEKKTYFVDEIQLSSWSLDKLWNEKFIKNLETEEDLRVLVRYLTPEIPPYLEGSKIQNFEQDLSQRMQELGISDVDTKTFRDKIRKIEKWLDTLPLATLRAMAVKKAREADQATNPFAKATTSYMFKKAILNAVKEGATSFGWSSAQTLRDRYSKTEKEYDSYDSLLPNLFKDLSKKGKWNATIVNKDGNWRVEITPEMAKAVLTNQFELFQPAFNSKHSIFKEDSPIHFERIEKATNAGELFETILSKEHPWENNVSRELVEKIVNILGLEYLKKIPIEHITTDQTSASVLFDSAPNAWDTLRLNMEYLGMSKLEYVNETLAHELTHIAIARSLETNKEFATRVSELAGEAWKSLPKQEQEDITRYNDILTEIRKYEKFPDSQDYARAITNLNVFLSDVQMRGFSSTLAYSFYDDHEFVANLTTSQSLQERFRNTPWYKRLWALVKRVVLGEKASESIGKQLEELLLNNITKLERYSLFGDIGYTFLVDKEGKSEMYAPFEEIVEKPSLKSIKAILDRFKDVSDYYNGADTILEAKDQARERFNASMLISLGKILPMSAIMKHKAFRRAYEFGMDYTEAYEVSKFIILSKKLEPMLRKMPKEVKGKIFEYIEDPDAVIPPKHEPYVQEVRDFISQMFEFVSESEYPNILDMEEANPNYLPHVFDKFKVELEFGDTTYYKSLYEAIEGAKALELQGEQIKNIGVEVGSDALDLFINNKRMHAAISKLQNTLSIDYNQAKELLSEAGVKGENARLNVEEIIRQKEGEAYNRDFEEVITFWTHRLIRAVHQNKYMDNMDSLLGQVQDQKAKGALRDYMDRTLGRPWAMETAIADFWNLISPSKERTAYDVRALSHKIAAYQYISDLGFMTSSAITNFSQIVMNTAPLIGVANTLGVSAKVLKALSLERGENYMELVNNGILQEVDMATETKYSRALNFPLRLFQMIERFNRATTYFAAKRFHESKGRGKAESILKLLGVPPSASIFVLSLPGEDFGRMFAKEVVNNTQFRGEAFNAPTLVASPLAKLISPYKTFMINQYVFMFRLMKHAIGGSDEARKAMAKFLLIALLLAGEKANLFTRGIFQAIDTAWKMTFGKSLKDEGKWGRIIEAGVPSIFGVDMSNAIAFYNPLDILTGAIPRLAKAGSALVEGDEHKAWLEIGPRFWKQAEHVWSIASKGEYKDREGKLLSIFEGKKAKGILQAIAGFTPTEVLKYYRLKEMDKDTMEWYRENVTERVKEWTDYTMTGKEAEAERVLQKMIAKVEALSKEYEKAKEGTLYQAEVGKKLVLLATSLSKGSVFKNSIKARVLPAPYREPKKTFRTYNIPLMEKFKSSEEEKFVEEVFSE